MADLAPKSERIGFRKATKKRMEVPANGMKVRAQNGPMRNTFFWFYPENGGCICERWPFCGEYADTMVLDSSGTILVYRLVPDPDPRRWGLHYDPLASVNQIGET
jgi:hypothetical protein